MTALTAMILRILLIIAVVWFLRRFLAAVFGYKKTESPKTTSTREKDMVKDPVCGMYMDPRLAIKHETRNGIFYFCSENCKTKFLEAPPGGKPE